LIIKNSNIFSKICLDFGDNRKMFRSRTLLERFKDPRPNEPLNTTQNIEALIESIISNLTKMLNTRQGGPMIQPDDYGMVDITDISTRFPDSVSDVQKAFRIAIEKYEPRLKNVQVEHIGEGTDLQTLKFKITAQLADRKGRESVYFETVVDPTGEVQLNG
jgi:type VI secretion system protein